MRRGVLVAVVAVLTLWAVVHITILSSSPTSSSYHNNPLSSKATEDMEEYLSALLQQASSLISSLEEKTNRTDGGLRKHGHSNPEPSTNTKAIKELHNALATCEVQKLEAMAEARKYKHSDQKEGQDSSHVALPAAPLRALDKWLVVGIPTVHRKNNEDYLLQSLRAIAEQLPSDPSDLMYGRILVIVVNVQDNPSAHTRYLEAKKEFHHSHHPKSMYFEFHDSAGPDVNPMPGSHDVGSPNKPGARVRRQTRDIAKVVQMSVNRGHYYLFSEDDMVLCPSGLTTMQYLISKASSYHPDWLAIRASYGMNGIIMHNKDLNEFANYMIENQKRRPPDHLVVEWYAGETPKSKSYKKKRANIGFRYNIFNHLGTVSTLRSTASPSYLTCYQELLEPTVFQVEAFNPKQCPHDDIWPCSHVEKSQQSHLDLTSLVRKHDSHSSAPVIPKGQGRKRKKGRLHR